MVQDQKIKKGQHVSLINNIEIELYVANYKNDPDLIVKGCNKNKTYVECALFVPQFDKKWFLIS